MLKNFLFVIKLFIFEINLTILFNPLNYIAYVKSKIFNLTCRSLNYYFIIISKLIVQK